MSLRAYQQAQTSAESPRQTEYRLFAEVTRSLREVRDSGKKGPEFFAALDWNRRMWTTLSTDCAVEGNELPRETRAGIISLSIWVNKFTSRVARGEDSIDALIDINRTIMEGLAMQQKAAGSDTEGATPSRSACVGGEI